MASIYVERKNALHHGIRRSSIYGVQSRLHRRENLVLYLLLTRSRHSEQEISRSQWFQRKPYHGIQWRSSIVLQVAFCRTMGTNVVHGPFPSNNFTPAPLFVSSAPWTLKLGRSFTCYESQHNKRKTKNVFTMVLESSLPW